MDTYGVNKDQAVRDIESAMLRISHDSTQNKVKGKPWAYSGAIDVSDCATAKEVMLKAGLNFNVAKIGRASCRERVSSPV